MAQVRFRGVRYAGVRVPAMATSFQVYCDMAAAEARDFAERIVRGERLSVHLEDPDVAYSMAAEMVDLGVNAEADESDF